MPAEFVEQIPLAVEYPREGVALYQGQLEIDANRGVVYFHAAVTGWTKLRICGIPRDQCDRPVKDVEQALDISLRADGVAKVSGGAGPIRERQPTPTVPKPPGPLASKVAERKSLPVPAAQPPQFRGGGSSNPNPDPWMGTYPGE